MGLRSQLAAVIPCVGPRRSRKSNLLRAPPARVICSLETLEMARIVLSVVAATAIVTGAAAAETITVCPDGCDYATLDPALQVATDGDSIQIGPGTYTTQVAHMIDRSIEIVGAEDGSTQLVGATPWTVTSSTSLALTRLQVLGNSGLSVRFSLNQGSTLTLNECQIIGASDNSSIGFISAADTTPGRVALRGCTLDSCIVSSPLYSPFIDAMELTIEDVVVRDCELVNANDYLFRARIAAEVADCTFQENRVEGYGFFDFQSPSITANIRSCNFQGNYARNYTSIATLVTIGRVDSCLLDGCVFLENQADCSASNLWLDSIRVIGGNRVEIRDCEFNSNDGRALVLIEQSGIPPVEEVLVSACHFIDHRPDPRCWPLDPSACPIGYAISIPITEAGAAEASGPPNPLANRLMISDSKFCGSGPISISGSWIDGGGNCVSYSCLDTDGDGSLDFCLDDGHPQVIRIPEDAPDLRSALEEVVRGQEIVLSPGDHVLSGLVQVSAVDVAIRAEVPIAGPANSSRIILAEDPATGQGGLRVYGSPGRGVVFRDVDLVLLNAIDDRACFGSGVQTLAAGSIIAENSSLAFQNCRLFADLSVPAIATFDSDLSLYACEMFGDSTNSPVMVIEAAYSNVELIDSSLSSACMAFEDSSAALSGTSVSGATGSATPIEGLRSNLTIAGCDFRGNSLESDSPSVARVRGGSLQIVDSWFLDNASAGETTGLLQARSGAVLSVGGCAFCGNQPQAFAVGTTWRDLGGNAFEELGCSRMRGDFSGDGCVTAADLGVLLQLWGIGGFPVADLDRDGFVGGADLGIMFLNWGQCP